MSTRMFQIKNLENNRAIYTNTYALQNLSKKEQDEMIEEMMKEGLINIMTWSN